MTTNVESIAQLPIDLGPVPTAAPNRDPAEGAFRQHFIERKPTNEADDQVGTNDVSATAENSDSDNAPDVLDDTSAAADEALATNEAASVEQDEPNDEPQVDDEIDLIELPILIDHGGIHAIDEAPPSTSDEPAGAEINLSPESEEAESILPLGKIEPTGSIENKDATAVANATPAAKTAEVPGAPAIEVPEAQPPESKSADVAVAPKPESAPSDEASVAKQPQLVEVPAEEDVANTNVAFVEGAAVVADEQSAETKTPKQQDQPNDAKHNTAAVSGTSATHVPSVDGNAKPKRGADVAKPPAANGVVDVATIEPRIEQANKMLQEAAAIINDARPDEAVAAMPSQSDETEQQTARPTTANNDQVNAMTAKSASGEQRLSSLLGGRTSETQHSQPISETQQARIVQRVAKAFDVARTRGESTVRLRLSPPELGSLRLEVQIESGSLIAKLEVETPAAREVVLDNLHALRQRLADQNIRVDQFDVELLDQHADDPREQADKQPRDRSNADQRRSAHEESRKTTAPKTQIPRVERLLNDGVIDVTI